MDVRSGVTKEKEILPLCNISGKKSGHLRGVCRTGEVGAGEYTRKLHEVVLVSEDIRMIRR